MNNCNLHRLGIPIESNKYGKKRTYRFTNIQLSEIQSTKNSKQRNAEFER
jgi:hypothetical protein